MVQCNDVFAPRLPSQVYREAAAGAGPSRDDPFGGTQFAYDVLVRAVSKPQVTPRF